MLTFSISTSSRSCSFCSRSCGEIASRSACFSGVDDGEVRRQRVGEAVRVVDLERRGEALEGEVVRELRVLLEEAEDLAHVLLELLDVHRAGGTGSTATAR